jgi:hypothetical protein
LYQTYRIVCKNCTGLLDAAAAADDDDDDDDDDDAEDCFSLMQRERFTSLSFLYFVDHSRVV